MASIVVAPPQMPRCTRMGWSGPTRWQREVQRAARVADPKCAFRKRSLAHLRDTLRDTVTGLINDIALPRLLRRYGACPALASPMNTGPEIADRLCAQVLRGDTAGARHLLGECLAGGAPLDQVLMDLMSTCEELVDDRLSRDRCSSFDATLATCLLRTLALELVHEHGPQNLTADTSGRWACVVATPGDSLRYATVLHECYLQMAGWDIEKLEGVGPAALRRRLWEQPPDAVIYVLNDPRLRPHAAEQLGRLRVGQGVGEGPYCIGVGEGFAGCERWPCQVELDAVASEPRETAELATLGRCCST